MQENKAIPVLVVEDDVMINYIIQEIGQDIPTLEIVIVKTKDEAINVLKNRNDFSFAFVDWNLEEETSQGIIQLIYKTQKEIKKVFATSACSESRKNQMIIEGAHHELGGKHEILTVLNQL